MKITGTLSDEYSNSKGNFQDINLEIDLDLRDYFAAKAMQGCIVKGAPLVFQDIASKAYEMADSMLLERSKNDK